MTRRRLLAAVCGTSLVLPAELAEAEPQNDASSLNAQELTVTAGELALIFRADRTGIAVTRIANRSTGAEHLRAPAPLFKLARQPDGESCESNLGVQLGGARLNDSGSVLEANGVAAGLSVAFQLRVESLPDENAALCRLSLTNKGAASLSLRTTAPYIQGLKTAGPHGPMMAAVPQEAGGVVSFSQPVKPLGMSVNPKIGLPTAMNTMELASLYDAGGSGGVFFADAEADLDLGKAPVEFTFSGADVFGHALLQLNAGETKALPSFTIGVHTTGDWHAAVDHYVSRHRAHWHFPEIPAWLRDQGAIYSFSGAGGGAIYMEFPQQDLASRLSSFDKLPALLEEAQKLGTNIVYLWDYWEGTTEGGRPPYWNKGDYVPRADLGGPVAFKNGIRQVHERGGRVILYLEPFIIFQYSQIGKREGQSWAGRDWNGTLYRQYPQNYAMISCLPAWQKFLVAKATALVRDFDVDGIYLDSWGWQLNWPMKAASDSELFTPLQYCLGVLDLAKQVREAIRAVRPDAIVMGESTSGALSRYWDGGLSADFAWLAPQNQHRILGSPVRYGMPEMNIFSNGRNLNELNQVFAAGHSLALLNANLPDAEYIRTLVQIRQKYKDAMIYGKQVCQPQTRSTSVPAYYYRGSTNRVLTVVNIATDAYSGPVALEALDVRPAKWRNLITGDTLEASQAQLQIELAAHSLLVLVPVESTDEGR